MNARVNFCACLHDSPGSIVVYSTLGFSAGKTTDEVKAVITSQLKNNGGLLTNSSVGLFRADVDSLSVDVSATGINRQASTNDTPASTHRPVSFTITHVRQKNKDRGEESTSLMTAATTEVRISDATMVATLFLGATKSNVVGEDAGTQGSARISPVSSATQAAMTTLLENETTTQLETEREETITKFSVLESTETKSPEGEATTQIVVSTGRTIQQESESDESTQLMLSSEHTTRSSILFTTDQSSDPLHISTEATTESLPLTITTASEPEQSSTSAVSMDTVSAEVDLYPSKIYPATESPSTENAVTESISVNDFSGSTPVWSAITDSLIRIAVTVSHPVQNAVSESTIVDNPFTESHRVDTTITESPRVDNPITESPRVDNAVTESPRMDNAVTDSHHVDNDITENQVVDNTVTENPHVDNPVTESHHMGNDITDNRHVDNAVTVSPSSASDATKSITTDHPRNGSAVTPSHLLHPATAESPISTQWSTKYIPTAPLSSERTLIATEQNFRTSKAPAIQEGFDTTQNAEETTAQAITTNSSSHPTKIDYGHSTNDWPFTVTIESHTLTGMTRNKLSRQTH